MAVAETAVGQRFSSTKRSGKAWHRPRSMTPRSAEQIVLRDFRWSHTDPIAFSRPPASIREYARREITRRADPGQPQNQRGQGDVMENPGGISITSGDRERQLQDQLRAKEAERQTDLQERKKAQEQSRTAKSSLLQARDRIRHLEDGVDRQKRETEKRHASYELEIAAERSKAKMEERREAREAREAFNRTKAEGEAALKAREDRLSQRQANFDAMEAETREKARVDALRDAEEAYLAKYDEMKTWQRELEKDQANLEEDKATLGSKVADAKDAARKEVKTETQLLIASITQNAAMINAHLTEAARLEDRAARVERDAIKGAEYRSRKHGDMLQSRMSTFERTLSEECATAVKERNAAIADFQSKQKNAEYREQVERSGYDNYHEIWENLKRSSLSLIHRHREIADELRCAANAWEEAAKFDASIIHRSLPTKYPNLTAQVKEFQDLAREHATLVANSAEQGAEDFFGHALRNVISQGHFSRMLTRFHRFDKSQDNGEMARILMAVLGEPLLVNLQRDTERKRVHINNQLKTKANEARVELLEAEADECSRDLETIKAVSAFLSSLSSFETLKALRDDTDLEKKLHFATRNLAVQMREVRKPWLAFLDDSHSDPDGGVDKEEQLKDRREIKRLHGDMQNEFGIYHKSIWEQSILEQHLGEGEGGEQISKINAIIDGEMMEARARVLSTLERVTHQRSSRPLRLPRQRSSRPLAFRATPLPDAPVTSIRRFAGSRRVRSLPRVLPTTERASTAADDQKIDRSETGGDGVQKLTRNLKDDGNYRIESEKQEDVDEFERLKREGMRRNLEGVKRTRLALERDPKASPEMLRTVEANIRGLERRLAPTGPTVGKPRTRTRNERRRARTMARPKTTRGSDSPPPNKSGGTSTPSLMFTPSASQRAWHPLFPHTFHPFHGHQSKANTTSQGLNVTLMSNLPGVSRHDAMFTPNVLQVYSLHSLHRNEIHEEHESDAEDFPDLRSTSILRTTSSFGAPIGLTQSSMETVSDPESASESDGSYEPSDTEISMRGSTALELTTEMHDVDPSSSLMSTQEFVDAAESQPATLSGTTAAVDQVDGNLSYKISLEDYRQAAMASASTNAAFWTYKLYKNPEGKTPTIHYCTNLEAAEAQAKQFLNEPVLGFDLEWEMGAYPGKSSIKDCVSLVQIASETKIGLFQLALFKGNTAEQLMPPSLRQILESQGIIKTGVNVAGDVSRVEKCFGLKMYGLFELSHLYNLVTWSESSPERVNKKLFNLADQVQNVLLLPLKKDKVRTSQWSKRLRLEQTEYAASDAYAGFRLYHALETRRKKMNPAPPRPAFWEERKPLILGDGTVVVPKKKKKVSADGKVVEVEDEDEEYFDAVETLDPYQLDHAETANIPLEGLSISYPTLPTLDDDVEQPALVTEDEQARSLRNERTTATAPPESTQADPKPRPTTLSSPAVTLANCWAQTFRNGLPANHLLKTKQAHLRAYHLWHYQHNDCRAVAALLRDPPLGLNTVASYVLQSVSMGKDLDFDKDRFIAVVELLPRNIQPKYVWVIERLERVELEREVGRGYG